MDPVIAPIIEGAGVDVVLLAEMAEPIYIDITKSEGSDGIAFSALVDLLLNMRGTNPAKVCGE